MRGRVDLAELGHRDPGVELGGLHRRTSTGDGASSRLRRLGSRWPVRHWSYGPVGDTACTRARSFRVVLDHPAWLPDPRRGGPFDPGGRQRGRGELASVRRHHSGRRRPRPLRHPGHRIRGHRTVPLGCHRSAGQLPGLHRDGHMGRPLGAVGHQLPSLCDGRSSQPRPHVRAPGDLHRHRGTQRRPRRDGQCHHHRHHR